MFISVRDVPTLVSATIYRQPKITTHLENSGNCTDMCPPPVPVPAELPVKMRWTSVQTQTQCKV